MLASAAKQQQRPASAAASSGASMLSGLAAATAQLQAIAHLGDDSPVAAVLRSIDDATTRRIAINLITAQRAAEKARAEGDKAVKDAFTEMDTRFRAQAEFRKEAKAVLTGMSKNLTRAMEVYVKTDQETSAFLVQILTEQRNLLELRGQERLAAASNLQQSRAQREADVARLETHSRQTSRNALHKAGRLATLWNAAETRHRGEDAMMVALLRASLEEAEARWSNDVRHYRTELATTVRRHRASTLPLLRAHPTRVALKRACACVLAACGARGGAQGDAF